MAKPNLRENIVVMARNGDRLSHVLRLGKVLSRNKDDTPRLVEILRDDEKVTIKGGESFITLYTPLENFPDAKYK